MFLRVMPEIEQAALELAGGKPLTSYVAELVARDYQEKYGYSPPRYLGDHLSTWHLRPAPGAPADVGSLSGETGLESPLPAPVEVESKPSETAEEAQEKLSAAELWARLVPLLVAECGAEWETVWLSSMTPARLSSACLYVLCRDSYYCDSLIDQKLPGILARLAGGLLGRSISVVLKAKKAVSDAPAVAPVAAPVAVPPSLGPVLLGRSRAETKILARLSVLAELDAERVHLIRIEKTKLYKELWTLEDTKEAKQAARLEEKHQAAHAAYTARLEAKRGRKDEPPD